MAAGFVVADFRHPSPYLIQALPAEATIGCKAATISEAVPGNRARTSRMWPRWEGSRGRFEQQRQQTSANMFSAPLARVPVASGSRKFCPGCARLP
eukprot:11274257-Alexandrium_andersonii.AAC.1